MSIPTTSAAEVTVLEVVAAVIERDGLVLACRRRTDRSAGGLWEFPGELTADVTVVGGRSIRLVCLRATLLDAAPESSIDHDELRWMLPADLPSLEWAAPDLPAVRLLARP